MTITAQRAGEILRTTLEILQDGGGKKIHRNDLQGAVEQRIEFTPAEQRIARTRDQMPAWGMRFGWGLSAAKAIGWTDNGPIGWWTLTSAGQHALRDFPGEKLFAELKRLEVAIKK